jgi:GTP:adenosylcobinamide-phosphate guanylyltransferase
VKVPAIVTAGDRGAAKAIYGQSKVYLEIDGIPLVVRVVQALQQVPEVSEVWVVGDRDRLDELFARPKFSEGLEKPLHIVGQYSNLYENAWETFKRTLPGAGPDGREPVGDDYDFQVLYLSGDLPLATPQEISRFIQDGQGLGCDYALGLSPARVLEHYAADDSGRSGLDIAYFNTRDGRLKQNNLHLAKPSRVLNRNYIQDLYSHRHMRKFGNMVGLIGKLLFREGGIAIFFFYMVMHLAGLADRSGWKRLASWIRYCVTVKANEWGVSKLLACRFRFVVSDYAGCAIDVDTEADYDVIQENFREWSVAELPPALDCGEGPRSDRPSASSTPPSSIPDKGPSRNQSA